MTIALCIDKVYSRVMTFFVFFSIVLTAVTVYLYFRLPNIIPIHWYALLKMNGSGYKASLFLFPLTFGILSMVFSKRWMDYNEALVLKRLLFEIIGVVCMTFLALLVIFVYFTYFRMI